MNGHAIIVNKTSGLSFVLEFNPTTVETTKAINYVIAPNIGGSHKKRYFTGFDSEEIEFSIQCIDKENPVGVKNQIAFFDQLRKPDPGLFGIASSFFGNENYPPPQILFQFGVSFLPVVWDVLDVGVTIDHFHDDPVRGVIGIPKMAVISVKLALVEDSVLNKANQIAEKAALFAGSIESSVKNNIQSVGGGRRESWTISPIKIGKNVTVG